MKKSVLAAETVIITAAAVSMNTGMPMIIAGTDTIMIIASAVTVTMPVDVGVIMSMGIN